MFELLLYSSMACADADALILGIKKHEGLKATVEVRIGRDRKGICTRM